MKIIVIKLHAYSSINKYIYNSTASVTYMKINTTGAGCPLLMLYFFIHYYLGMKKE